MVLVFLTIIVVGGFLFWPGSYSRFRHKGESYYAEFTTACDTILVQHPLGTNRFIEVSVLDASLPKIIQDLQPAKIKLSSNRVWILSNGGEFGISWELEDETKTNAWLLITSIESQTTILYTVKK